MLKGFIGEKDHFVSFYLFILKINSYFKIHIYLYFLFFFIILLFSIFLIFISNPIYSVISLIIIYFFAAFILICFEMHFLAVIFILVYLGAVVVLFLFIVMMLNVKVQSTLKIFNIIPLIFLVCFMVYFFKENFFFKNYLDSFELTIFDNILRSEFGYYDLLSLLNFFDIFSNIFFLSDLKYKKDNFIVFGFLLYSYFYVEVCFASYILLLAMVGCITLSLIKNSFNYRKQEAMEQLLLKTEVFKRVIFSTK